MQVNEKYSRQDWTNRRFFDTFPAEWNGTIVDGACFYQEAVYVPMPVDPSRAVFPIGMTGVTFRRCNLDNCVVPVGNTVEASCSHRKIRVQNDRDDWVLDVANRPVEPVNRKARAKVGLTIDPRELPDKPITRDEFEIYKRALGGAEASVVVSPE